jgi:DNA-binding MarR family transcriptional regulator
MEKDAVDELLEQWREERPELDVSALAIAVRIEMLAKLMKRSTAENLSRVGLKTWEYDVLSGLRRQGPPFELPTTQLAKESLLTSGAMTTRIDHLEERGLVRRQPDPNDRRGVRVSLTERGVAIIDDAIQSRLTAADVSARSLSINERAAFENGLRKLLVSIGPSDSD